MFLMYFCECFQFNTADQGSPDSGKYQVSYYTTIRSVSLTLNGLVYFRVNVLITMARLLLRATILHRDRTARRVKVDKDFICQSD